ncbi:MAG: hypothetical protein MUP58_01020 [Candidatus Nanohaloarchaeota archaeon QJJ-9]|nr:hypothetical protein [Candidatus Nanohaloarchaeota archaeon QJJ-9]
MLSGKVDEVCNGAIDFDYDGINVGKLWNLLERENFDKLKESVGKEFKTVYGYEAYYKDNKNVLFDPHTGLGELVYSKESCKEWKDKYCNTGECLGEGCENFRQSIEFLAIGYSNGRGKGGVLVKDEFDNTASHIPGEVDEIDGAVGEEFVDAIYQAVTDAPGWRGVAKNLSGSQENTSSLEKSYDVELAPEVRHKLEKLDKSVRESIQSSLDVIGKRPDAKRNLSGGLRKKLVDRSYEAVFRINEDRELVKIVDLGKHNEFARNGKYMVKRAEKF